MGRFAVSAIVEYRLSFTDQGKQTFVYRFRLQQADGSWPILFYVCSKQKEVAIFRLFRLPFAEQEDGDKELGDIDMRHRNIEKYIHGHGDMAWRH
jgi:hypothetical protein